MEAGEGSLGGQNTIASEVSCRGFGLHSGREVLLTLRPAQPGDGIFFRHVSSLGSHLIPALPHCISGSAQATTLRAGDDQPSISTVEHVLAALVSMEIDNVEVEVDANELPVLDGSSLPFVSLIERAGIRAQAPKREVARVVRKIDLAQGERRICIEPWPTFGLDVSIDFEHAAIGQQRIVLPDLTPAIFRDELAAARTFGFMSDLEALERAGLARGASLENTIVLDERSVMNPGGLRWPDEFVRHKALDLVGDLALLGRTIKGRVIAERGGHALHHRLVAALAEQNDALVLEGS